MYIYLSVYLSTVCLYLKTQALFNDIKRYVYRNLFIKRLLNHSMSGTTHRNISFGGINNGTKLHRTHFSVVATGPIIVVSLCWLMYSKQYSDHKLGVDP